MKLSLLDRVEIEIRATDMAFSGPPREIPLPKEIKTYGEWKGWGIHYWNQYGRSKADKRRAPSSKDELVGWLAREIFLVCD